MSKAEYDKAYDIINNMYLGALAGESSSSKGDIERYKKDLENLNKKYCAGITGTCNAKKELKAETTTKSAEKVCNLSTGEIVSLPHGKKVDGKEFGDSDHIKCKKVCACQWGSPQMAMRSWGFLEGQANKNAWVGPKDAVRVCREQGKKIQVEAGAEHCLRGSGGSGGGTPTPPSVPTPSTPTPTPTPTIKDIEVCEIEVKKENNVDVTTYKKVSIKENAFDAKKHDKDLKKCTDIAVCELGTFKPLTIKESEFDDKKHDKDLKKCTQIPVCNLADKKSTIIKESEFDDKKHSKDMSICNDIRVCVKASKKVETIKENEFKDEVHTKDLTVCGVTPENIQVCNLETKQKVSIKENEFDGKKHSKDLAVCDIVNPVIPSNPTHPGQLPKTGMSGTLIQVIALGSAAAGGGYYLSNKDKKIKKVEKR